METTQILQILPDVFYEEVLLKPALCIRINKKHTSSIIQFLKNKNLTNEKTYLKEEYKDEKSSIPSYAIGSYSNNKKSFGKYLNYLQYDISFLKRVKPLNDENLLMIGFQEV